MSIAGIIVSLGITSIPPRLSPYMLLLYLLSHPSPGEDEAEQLQCMMEVLNVPSKGLIDQSTRRKLFFDGDDAPRITANSHGKLRIPGGASRGGGGGEFSDLEGAMVPTNYVWLSAISVPIKAHEYVSC